LVVSSEFWYWRRISFFCKKPSEGGGGVGPSVEEAKEVAGILRPGTKTVPLNKGRGAKVADFLMVYGGLLDRPFGSGAMIAATGDVVIERVQQEIESLRGIEGVNEQILFEILRFLRLLEMDLKLVGAAKQESTLFQRLEQAKKTLSRSSPLSQFILEKCWRLVLMCNNNSWT
jgi:hypothetical protein